MKVLLGRLVIALICIVAVTPAMASPECTAVRGDYIETTPEKPAALSSGNNVRECLESKSGLYFFVLDKSGEWFIEKRDGTITARSNKPFSKPQNGYTITLQSNGLLAIAEWSYALSGSVNYYTGTDCGSPKQSGNFYLTILDDGNLVVFRGKKSPTEYPGIHSPVVWSTTTGSVCATGRVTKQSRPQFNDQCPSPTRMTCGFDNSGRRGCQCE